MHNVMAAWRSGGLYGIHTFNFALHVLRSDTRHCVKPLVIVYQVFLVLFAKKVRNKNF